MNNFNALPCDVRRAVEVAMVANFKFQFIDKTSNRFYKGLIEDNSYYTSIPEEEMRAFSIVRGEPIPFDHIADMSDKEPYKVVEKRAIEGRGNMRDSFEELVAEIKDNQSGYQIFKKAYIHFEMSYITFTNTVWLSEAIRCSSNNPVNISSNHIAEAVQYTGISS